MTTLPELMSKILELFPEMELDQASDGELMIYTKMWILNDGKETVVPLGQYHAKK